jgi:ERCC4-type nuclease
LYDGRLSTSLVKLTKCEKRVLILEGQPKWTTSGFLVSDYVQFSRAQLRNLLMSAHSELDIHTIWTDGVQDTKDVLHDLSRWALKERHDSIFIRPDSKDHIVRRWTKRDYAVHFLQGFDGVGPELARRIFDHFGRVPLSVDDEAELLKVKGMGPGRLKKMKGILL